MCSGQSSNRLLDHSFPRFSFLFFFASGCTAPSICNSQYSSGGIVPSPLSTTDYLCSILRLLQQPHKHAHPITTFSHSLKHCLVVPADFFFFHDIPATKTQITSLSFVAGNRLQWGCIDPSLTPSILHLDSLQFCSRVRICQFLFII